MSTGKWDSEYKAEKKAKQHPQWTEEELKRYSPKHPWAGRMYRGEPDPKFCVEHVSDYQGLADYSHQCTRKPVPGLQICGTHKSAVDRAIAKREQEERKRTEQELQRAADNAEAGDLNARIAGITGEPSHIIVRGGNVVGFDVASLQAVLRAAEDTILGVRH